MIGHYNHLKWISMISSLSLSVRWTSFAFSLPILTTIATKLMVEGTKMINGTKQTYHYC